MPHTLTNTICADTIARARTRHNVPWCADFERMVSGNIYDAMVPELVNARAAARVWMHNYNNTNADRGDPAVEDKRVDMLRECLGKVGDGAFIEPIFSFDYGCNITLGLDFYANFG